MENANYEEVLRRRQERRRIQRRRRKRKVMMMYMLIFTIVLAGAVCSFAFWKNRINHENDAEKVFSNAEGASTDIGNESQGGEPEAIAAANQSPESQTSPDDPNHEGSYPNNEEGQTSGEDENGKTSQPDPGNTKQGNLFQRFFAWVRGLFGGEERTPDNTTIMAAGNPGADGLQDALPEESVPETQPGALGEGDEGDSEVQVPDVNTPEGRLANLLFLADRLAQGYDYDQAIALLQTNEEFLAHPDVLQAAAQYEEEKASLVEYNLKEITHVFFHSLVMDNARAFDGDNDSKGYNQVMTTKNEFLQILQEMYNRGFVLVRLHDIAHEEMDENGNMRMVKGKIMLPEGKKAFVMSQDDVCYYPYMSDDGFAKRIIIGEDGKPTCVMELEDGTEVVGSYDLVPLLEDFIQMHPDFSYKGARAVIAFTGYEGILGYRTAASYQTENPNYEADRQQAAAVAQCLRDNGWELASHSWGHRYLGQIDFDKFVTDSDKWEAEVESIIGPTDIILFPFGDDVGDWHPYTSENERFNYLYSLGFRYFCNVDSAQYWVQIGDTFVRQGRRNLDGYRMWKDIEAGQEGRTEDRKLDDLFRAEDIFDPARPTPVEWE